MDQRRHDHDEPEPNSQPKGGMKRRMVASCVGDKVLRMDHSHRSFPFPYDQANLGERPALTA